MIRKIRGSSSLAIQVWVSPRFSNTWPSAGPRIRKVLSRFSSTFAKQPETPLTLASLISSKKLRTIPRKRRGLISNFRQSSVAQSPSRAKPDVDALVCSTCRLKVFWRRWGAFLEVLPGVRGEVVAPWQGVSVHGGRHMRINVTQPLAYVGERNTGGEKM